MSHLAGRSHFGVHSLKTQPTLTVAQRKFEHVSYKAA